MTEKTVAHENLMFLDFEHGESSDVASSSNDTLNTTDDSVTQPWWRLLPAR